MFFLITQVQTPGASEKSLQHRKALNCIQKILKNFFVS